MAVRSSISRVFVWPLVVLTITIAVLLTKPWQTKTTDTIAVTSTGTFQTTPNIAQITATVENKNPNLDEARSQNEQKISQIINKLEELKIEKKDIKTSQISGGQGYEIMDNSQSLIYPAPPRPKPINQFSTSLEITIRDLTIADEVIAALSANGATNIYGPNLSVSPEDLEKAKSGARENAVENAKNKAQELANLSDRKIGKAVKITEAGDYGLPVPMYAKSEADLVQKANQIQPGQSAVTINLSVEFALK